MYLKVNENVIERLSDGTFIPADPSNADYQSYLAWIAVGNSETPPLATAQAQQISRIESAYQNAIQQPVAYLGTTFQADSGSQDVLAKVLVAGSVPTGMFWLDSNNTPVAVTFAQLQGLAGAMLMQGQAAFAKKTGLKAQIRSATSVADAQAIAW